MRLGTVHAPISVLFAVIAYSLDFPTLTASLLPSCRSPLPSLIAALFGVVMRVRTTAVNIGIG